MKEIGTPVGNLFVAFAKSFALFILEVFPILTLDLSAELFDGFQFLLQRLWMINNSSV